MLDYSSEKARRVVHSIMGGETLALSEGFDVVFSLARDLSRVYNRRVSIRVYTDSQQLFDTVSKGKRTTERSLMIDVAAIRQAYGVSRSIPSRSFAVT